MSDKKKIEKDVRVKRVNGLGCQGVVSAVRKDQHGTEAEKKERGVMIGVQWDNGTFSFFTEDALEVVS